MADARGALLAPSIYPACAGPGGIATADLDEDGHLDVVVACAGGSPALYRGSASGQLTPVVPEKGQPAPLGAPGAVAVLAADVDHDGHADLVFSDVVGGRVLFGAGQNDLTFRNNAQPLLVLGAGAARTLQAVDLDGDGALDLVLANGASVLVALSKGVSQGAHLGFQDAAAVPLMARAVAAWAADLDADGAPDLLVADNAAPFVKVLLNTNAGGGQIAFGAPASYPVASQPLALVVADLDGDKLPDLATANNLDRSVSVLLGRGKGLLGGLANHDVGVNPTSLAVGDVNGDGKPDLATGNGNTVTVLVRQ